MNITTYLYIMEFKNLTISVPKNLLKKFKEYCRSEGMKISNRLVVLMERDLKKK